MAQRSLFAALLVLAICSAFAEEDPVWLNDGDSKSGEILESEVTEFMFQVDGTTFSENMFDIHVVLDVLSGDCDLVVKGPKRFLQYSEHPAGADVLFIPRQDILSVCDGVNECIFRILIVGYSPVAEYSLLFDIETDERILHADDQQIIETIYSACCAGEGACSSWESTVLASGVGEIANFCHLDKQICDANGHITHMDLSDSGLQCNLPPALGALSTVERLFLNDNSITGTFETFMGLASGMSNLKHVHMADTELSGDLVCCPAGEADCLNHLKTLDLKRNNIEGSLPSCLVDLPEIGVLNLRENKLSGDFPATLSPNTHMVVLDVRSQEGSGMSGTLPDFRPLVNMALLGLSGNNFEGSVPAVPSNLEALHLSDNKLTGKFHQSYDLLEKIWIFEASNNAITGQIPPSLAVCETLKILNLANNSLTGPIPETWGATNIRMITMENNDLSGGLPGGLAALNRLAILNVTGNKLTGSLQSFGENIGFNALRQFSFSDNQITGGIPEEFQRLSAFSLFPSLGTMIPQVFDASFNELNGDFPEHMVETLVRLESSDSYDFTFSMQGNFFSCPDGELEDVIVSKLPEVAASTCKDADELRTISSAPIPDAVISKMNIEPIAAPVVVVESQEKPSVVAPGPEETDASSVSGSSLLIIIGVAVGVLVVVIIAAILLAVFVIKPMMAKRQGKKYEEYDPERSTAASAPVIQAKQEGLSDAQEPEPLPTMTDIEMS